MFSDHHPTFSTMSRGSRRESQRSVSCSKDIKDRLVLAYHSIRTCTKNCPYSLQQLKGIIRKQQLCGIGGWGYNPNYKKGFRALPNRPHISTVSSGHTLHVLNMEYALLYSFVPNAFPQQV